MIGAGASGCAVVAGLRQGGFQGAISLWEAGRGPGGRCATRRSRRDPTWRLDHGAPLFNITGLAPLPVMEELTAGGWIEAWTPRCGVLAGDGQLLLGDHEGVAGANALTQGRLYRGRGGMDGLCQGLLATARGNAQASEASSAIGQGPRPIATHYGVLVRRLAFTPDGTWELFNEAGERLTTADWLVLSGTLLAHPRSVAVMGWSEIPLQQAAAGAGDPALEQALAAIATLRYAPRTNLLLRCEAEAAGRWRALPVELLDFGGAEQQRWGWRRLSIQMLPDGRCGVVLHTSATVPEAEEEEWIQSQCQRLADTLATWLGPSPPQPAARELMRWRAAFPLAPGLPAETMVCPTSRIAFCGDGFAGPGQGRVEGALHSGLTLSSQLLGQEPAKHGAPGRDAAW